MGINVKIGDKWRIRSDSQEFSLYKKGFNKKKNIPTETVVGHYSCLDHCVMWLINKDVAASDCKTLKEVVDHIREFREMVEESLSIGIPDYSLKPAKLLKRKKG